MKHLKYLADMPGNHCISDIIFVPGIRDIPELVYLELPSMPYRHICPTWHCGTHTVIHSPGRPDIPDIRSISDITDIAGIPCLPYTPKNPINVFMTFLGIYFTTVIHIWYIRHMYCTIPMRQT